ncbi:MAG: serine hydrolase domain-containing protein [Parachlamydiales bacterium]
MKFLFLLLILFSAPALSNPGLAVGIVRVGEAPEIWTMGPVDAHTPFPIASCTKTFTCHLVSQLGLNWDDPLANYLPYSNGQTTLRHLATHTTGTPRADELWQSREISQEALLQEALQLPITGEPGTHFEYSNVMYLALGRVAEQATGQSYEALLRRHIWGPLGMEATTIGYPPGTPPGYRWTDDQWVPVPYCNTEPVAPAGAICAPIEDMVKWVAYQLSITAEEARIPYSWTPAGDGYGLGWFITDYRGEIELYHPGGIAGFSSLVALLPERGIGVVLLTNSESGHELRTLAHQLFDQEVAPKS